MTRLAAAPENEFSDGEDVHLGPQKTVQRLLRAAYDRLVLVEGSIEHDGDVGDCAKLLDQAVIFSIGISGHRLQSPGAVDVGDGGNLGPPRLADLKYLHHEGNVVVGLEPVEYALTEN